MVGVHIYSMHANKTTLRRLIRSIIIEAGEEETTPSVKRMKQRVPQQREEQWSPERLREVTAEEGRDGVLLYMLQCENGGTATELGQGSSRRAYDVVWDGRRVALKIALNDAGVAQNRAEVESSAHRKEFSDILALVRDVDPRYSWIVSDLVEPLGEDNVEGFEDLSGVEWGTFERDLIDYLNEGSKHYRDQPGREVHPFMRKVIAFARRTNTKWGDLINLGHWGKTSDGRIVVLDYGFTEEVSEKHYPKRGQPAPAAAHDSTATKPERGPAAP